MTRGSYTRGLSADEYCALLGPALNWMGHFVSVNASRDKYAMLLGQFRDNCGVTVALRPLVVGFPPHLVAAFATRIVSMAKESEALGCAKVRPHPRLRRRHALPHLCIVLPPQCGVFVSLGDKLLQHPPPQEQRLGVLNETWKVVRQEQDLPTYTRAAVSYIRLLLRHYSDREVLILLKDLAKHLRHQHDQVHTVIELLGEVIDAVVDSRRGAFSPIVSSEYFLSVLDAFTVRAAAAGPLWDEAYRTRSSPPLLPHRATARRPGASSSSPGSPSSRAARATRPSSTPCSRSRATCTTPSTPSPSTTSAARSRASSATLSTRCGRPPLAVPPPYGCSGGHIPPPLVRRSTLAATWRSS